MEKDRLKFIVQHAANKISQISIYWDSISKRTKSLINIKTNLLHTRERERAKWRERKRTWEKKANAWEEEKYSRSWHRHELESLDLTEALPFLAPWILERAFIRVMALLSNLIIYILASCTTSLTPPRHALYSC
jgi:hypothetical protein